MTLLHSLSLVPAQEQAEGPLVFDLVPHLLLDGLEVPAFTYERVEGLAGKLRGQIALLLAADDFGRQP